MDLINPKLLMSSIAILPVFLLGTNWGVHKLQRWLIYPSYHPSGSRTEVDKPDKYGLPFEEVQIPVADGIKLHAYIMLQDPKSPDYTGKTVLMLGPNAGNIGHTLPIAELFYNKMKYNVVTYSYRGYGLSTGEPSEAGIKLDSQYLLRFLKDHPVIKETSLILYGRSLGGAVAIHFATLPESRGFLKGIILENTFLTIPKLIPSVIPIFRPLSFLVTQVWDSEKTILSINDVNPDVPILFLAGARDDVVPPKHFRKLYDDCLCKRKLFRILPDGAHNNTVLQPNYWDYVYQFILTLVEPIEGEAKEGEDLNDDDIEVLLRMAEAEQEEQNIQGDAKEE